MTITGNEVIIDNDKAHILKMIIAEPKVSMPYMAIVIAIVAISVFVIAWELMKL